MTTSLPVLYSFRRCPYAMRARLGLVGSGLGVELREVVLRNKPAEMLEASPKGTVPVMVLPDGQVIDESIDIIFWALGQNDPQNWLQTDQPEQAEMAKQLIQENDQLFKPELDRYKYFERFPDKSQTDYRTAGEVTLSKLENLLQQHRYLTGDRCSIADIAIFPFIRQFAHVDREWFFAANYPALQAWLNHFIESAMFKSIMIKYTPWEVSDPAITFPPEST